MNAGNVRELNAPNLTDIPRMLRYWAGEFDAGRIALPRAAYLVLVPPGRGFPQAAAFGQPLGALEEAGLFLSLANEAARPAPADSD